MRLAKQILMPVDIQEIYQYQLDMVALVAKSFNSSVIPLHVLPSDGLSEPIKKMVEDKVKEKLTEIVGFFAESGVVVEEPIIKYGSPFDQIIQMAMDLDVNLIVAGSGQNVEEAKFKLGITNEKLLQKSDKPVWVVKPPVDTAKISSILCPVDFSEPSTRAFKNAIEITKRFGASLTILSVFEPLSNSSLRLGDLVEAENKRNFSEQKKRLDDYLLGFDLNGLNFSVQLKKGIPHEQILEQIREKSHDLLIMGTTGRTGLSRILMGSVTEKVIREMPCSFIATKSENIINLNLKSQIVEIEGHYRKANELFEQEKYNEALTQYMICLQINNMHIPSIYKIAKVYQNLNDKAKAEYYELLASDLMIRTWGKDFGNEIKKQYGFDK